GWRLGRRASPGVGAGGRQPPRHASADAARQARLAGRAGARRSRDARAAADQAATTPSPELLVVRDRADRAELALAVAVPADDPGTADHGAVQTVLPAAGAERAGQGDLDQRRHNRRDAEGEGPLSGARQESADDQAVRDPGPIVLERQPAHGSAQRTG